MVDTLTSWMMDAIDKVLRVNAIEKEGLVETRSDMDTMQSLRGSK